MHVSKFVTVEQTLKWDQVREGCAGLSRGRILARNGSTHAALGDCGFLFAAKTGSHSLHWRNWQKGHSTPPLAPGSSSLLLTFISVHGV